MTTPSEGDVGRLWLDETARVWQRNKDHADSAIAQLSEEQLRQPLDPELNSVAVVMKHVAGNLRSRWVGFLTSDGERADRNRDGEFVDDYPDRAAILADWEDGWRVLFEELAKLQPGDLRRTILRPDGPRGDPPLDLPLLLPHRANCADGPRRGGR